MPLLLVTPVIVASLALSIAADIRGRVSARALVAQQLAEIHERIQGHIAEQLGAPPRITQINASLIGQGKLPMHDLGAWRDTLIAQMHAYDMLSTVGWGAADGRAVWVTRYAGDDQHTFYAIRSEPGEGVRPMTEYRVAPDGAVASDPSNVFDFDPRVRPWYTTPAEAGAAAWSEPYVWVGGDATEVTLGISYGRPMRDASGELLGIVDADLSLSDISRYLARLSIGERGAVFVLDGEGRIIASSIPARAADEQLNRIAARESEQPWLAAAAAAIDASAAVGALHQQTIASDGERLLLVAAPLRHEAGPHWNVLTLIPEAEFLAPVHAARQRNLVIGAVISVATIGFGLLIAAFMMRPLLTLTGHIQRIAEGKLDEEVHLSHSPELARLSDEINEMTAGLRDRMRMRHSLAVAMDVQQALLPSGSPSIKGLDVAGHSVYCDETGGDYFDYLEVSGVDDHSVVVALGDVMGHGVAAAMLMATARGILRSRATEHGSLADLLGHVNALLVPDTGGHRFMTMLLATVDAQARTLRWASAGHDPPFVCSAAGAFMDLDGAGLPLGIMDAERYEEYQARDLKPGQIILLATDGVWEMQNDQGEQFGKQRLRDVLAAAGGLSAEEVGRRIREALTAHRGGESPDDDVTFVVVCVL